jgi:hypothetical protein
MASHIFLNSKVSYMKKNSQEQENVGFKLGFALGAVFGIAGGLLWALSTRQDNEWEPLETKTSPTTGTSATTESQPHPPKRHARSMNMGTGSTDRTDSSAGRTVSNIDDLPDRG